LGPLREVIRETLYTSVEFLLEVISNSIIIAVDPLLSRGG
jgi:hypothetical protein